MQLSDFYFEDKAQIGSRMPILLPDGTDSGEWLNVIAPDADAAVKAGRNFLFAYRALTQDLTPLHKQCKEAKDFTEYNIRVNDKCSELNDALALEIVNGWSFEGEVFSREAFSGLLRQYRTLGNQVANYQAAIRKDLSEK